MRLEIGALGYVEPEALPLCFGAVTCGTIAENARLDIIIVPGQGGCLDCAKPVAIMERFDACPEDGHDHVPMTSGDDLRLNELEVD